MKLSELKLIGEAPQWMENEGFLILKSGYLGENETPRQMYRRVAKAAASYYSDFSYEERFFNAMWKNWLCLSSPVAANLSLDRGLPISCLTGDTWINTSDVVGGKKISDLQIGDMVLTHKSHWRRITAKTSRMSAGDLYELIIAGQTIPTVLKITGNHQVLTPDGWIRVDRLIIDKHSIATAIDPENDEQLVILSELKYLPIFSLKKLSFDEMVFDISVEEDHSFSAAGLIVHNCNSIHVADSIQSIFMKNFELAILSKHGSGVGIYIGDLRARGVNISGNGKSDGVIGWCKNYDSTIASVSQGCYDDQTEILTETGWEKFSSLKINTKVAQSSACGSISFVNFTNPVCYPVEEELYKFINKTASVDLLVTSNHRMAFEKFNNLSHKRNSDDKYISNDRAHTGFLEVKEAKDLKVHRDNRFWTAARGISGPKENLSWLERFFIAYQADGSTNPSGNSTGEKSGTITYAFRFKKNRKILRLREIIKGLSWNVTESLYEDGVTCVLVRVPTNIKLSKQLNEMFNLCEFSSNSANEFIEEISKWDGSLTRIGSVSYSSVIESNVDFVQSIAFLAGKMSTVDIPSKKEVHHQLRHKIYICSRDSVGGEDIVKTKEFYKGNVYCVSVPTGLLVVRRNGVVAICGNSTRRGAAAVYLPIDHGDISEFILLRKPTGDVNQRCLNLNHGVCITDNWMQSMLEGDKEKRLLWQEILKIRAESGEPYLIFIDNANNQNPTCYKDKGLSVKTSNICSEIFLHTDPEHSFVCCLSSLNLVRWEEWKDTDTVEITVRFLDAVLSEYIKKSEGINGLEASRRSAIKGRAIGIGVLGWHSFLQERNLPFDSFESMKYNNLIFKTMRERAEAETARMAQELGEPEWCKGHNRRHTHLLAVAPTVSNSTISGGYSAGIEPIAANIYSQKSAKGTFIRKNPTLERLLEAKAQNTHEVWRSINEYSGSVQHLPFLSDEEKAVFLTAKEINQHALIKQAAQRQKYIDQGQSLNLFFPANADPKYIHQVHLSAWELGLKSLYYYRTESVLKGDLAFRSKEECAACEA